MPQQIFAEAIMLTQIRDVGSQDGARSHENSGARSQMQTFVQAQKGSQAGVGRQCNRAGQGTQNTTSPRARGGMQPGPFAGKASAWNADKRGRVLRVPRRHTVRRGQRGAGKQTGACIQAGGRGLMKASRRW